jgi:RluA family pseudouridine synthase
LWSDEALLVVNKPAGLLAIAGGQGKDPHLREVLTPAFGPLWIVHRLDRDTSGVIALARSPTAHRALTAQFQEHRVTKTYHALVDGNPPWTEQVIDFPLHPNGDRRHRTVIDPHRGKPSATQLRVLERLGRYALIEAIPRTGRTHQIRAHLAALGMPIVADALYGGGSGLFLSTIKPRYRKGRTPERPLLGRLGLHALALAIEHPITQEKLRVEAPYPRDIRATLRQLQKYADDGT